MSEDKDANRAAFEAEMTRIGYINFARDDSSYFDLDVNDNFDLWNAAIAYAAKQQAARDAAIQKVIDGCDLLTNGFNMIFEKAEAYDAIRKLWGEKS